MESLLLGKWCRHVGWEGAKKIITKGQIVGVSISPNVIKAYTRGVSYTDIAGITFATLLLRDRSIMTVTLDRKTLIYDSKQEMNDDK